MPNTSNLQSNFHGGEWAPYSQGRMDRPDYRTGMAACFNGIPLEEGAWTRRPGFRRTGYTRRGGVAALREFHFNRTEPYLLELSNLFMRIWAGAPQALNSASLVVENSFSVVSGISTASPAVITTVAAHGLTDGQDVLFRLATGATDTGPARLLNRQFTVDVLTTTTFSITDAVTGEAFDGSTAELGASTLTVAPIYEQAMPYTSAQVADVRSVQDNRTLLLFHGDHAPRKLFNDTEPTSCLNGEFTLSTPTFSDGPYFDPETDGSTITPSGTSGSVTLTASVAKFASTDVGRMVRLLSEPPAYDAGTAYAIGDSVSYANLYFTATVATTGEDPLLFPTSWTINPKASVWTWATITAYTSSTQVTATISGDALVNTNAVSTYRLGLYSNTTGWPTGGIYHEGRLWIWGEVIPNRIDGSMTNDEFVFSPTDPQGLVADNYAVAAVFRTDNVDPIQWCVTNDQGLLAGTKSGEWIVRAASPEEAITPTSIKARRVTKYGSANIEPVRVGDALLMVNRFDRKLMEYMADAGATTARYSATNLSLRSKHLSAPGISQVCFQQELVPIVWARTALGDLIGMTYKKDGEYAGLPEDIQGWHRHEHGNSHTFEAIASGPTGFGLDTLYAVTYNADTGYRQVEQLSLIMGQNAAAATWNGLDASVVPTAAEIVDLGGGAEAIRYYGLDHLEGEEVSAWVAGYDMGEFTVTNGVINVPLAGADVPELTRSVLSSLTTGSTYFGLALTFAGGSTNNVVAPTVDVGSLTEYIRGAETLSESATGIIDSTNGFLYVISGGDGGTTSGYRKFNLETGALLDHATWDDLVANGWPDDGIAGEHVGITAVSPSSGYLYNVGGSSNTEDMQKLRIADWTWVATVGTEGGGTSGGGGILTPDKMVCTNVAGVDFVAGVSFAFDPGYITVFDGNQMSMLARLGLQMTGGNQSGGYLAVGRVETVGCTEATGHIWALCGEENVFTSETVDVSLYKINCTVQDGVSTITGAQLAALNPSDVDAGWTAFGDETGIRSFNYDQTDGHLLAVMTGNAAPTQYLVKYSSVDGSVIWKLALADAPDLGGHKGSVIRNGRIIYKSATGVSGAYPVYSIDTLAGTRTQIGTAYTVTAGTIWDGVNGYMIGRGTFDPSIDPPNAPTGTNTTDFDTEWYRWDGAAGSGGALNYTAPAVIGYRYTSQGQVLRPIFDAGAANGPALGKTRRAHQFAVLLQRSGPVDIGTDLDGTLRPAAFREPNGDAYEFGALYNGIVQDTIESDYDFDGQVAWQYTRPVPGTVLAVETFMAAQDR